eukprot:ANDGO_03747.mRNA.1 hypothetical protein
MSERVSRLEKEQRSLWIESSRSLRNSLAAFRGIDTQVAMLSDELQSTLQYPGLANSSSAASSSSLLASLLRASPNVSSRSCIGDLLVQKYTSSEALYISRRGELDSRIRTIEVYREFDRHFKSNCVGECSVLLKDLQANGESPETSPEFSARQAKLRKRIRKLAGMHVSVTDHGIQFPPEIWNRDESPIALQDAIQNMDLRRECGCIVKKKILSDLFLPNLTNRKLLQLKEKTAFSVQLKVVSAKTRREADVSNTMDALVAVEGLCTRLSLEVDLQSERGLLCRIVPSSFKDLENAHLTVRGTQLCDAAVTELWAFAKRQDLLESVRLCSLGHDLDGALAVLSSLILEHKDSPESIQKHVRVIVRDGMHFLFAVSTGVLPESSILDFLKQHWFMADFIVYLQDRMESESSAAHEEALARIDDFLIQKVFPSLQRILDPPVFKKAKMDVQNFIMDHHADLADARLGDHVLVRTMDHILNKTTIGSEESDYFQQLLALLCNIPNFYDLPHAAEFEDVCNVLSYSMSEIREHWDSGSLSDIPSNDLCRLVHALFEDNPKRRQLLLHLMK